MLEIRPLISIARCVRHDVKVDKLNEFSHPALQPRRGS